MGFPSQKNLTFFILIFFLWFFYLGKPDLLSDKTALLSLRSVVGSSKSLRWNETQQNPCSWKGVRCEKNRITSLHLPGTKLFGQIPTGIIGNLKHLRTLSLRMNALTGEIPSDLSVCTELRNLYLQGNRFSGELPSFLFGLRNLVHLSVAGNNFSGEISPAFNNLTRLTTLDLGNNQLSGSIPELMNLSNLVRFNVSFNQLNGSIPSRFRFMKANSFVGNSLCGEPLESCPNSKNKKEKKKLFRGAVIGIAITSVIGCLLILLLLILFSSCRKKSSSSISSRKVRGPIDVETVKYSLEEKGNVKNKLVYFGDAARHIDLEDLLMASAEVLEKGTFGNTYKVNLGYGNVVFVKRLKDVTISEKEFRVLMETIRSMNHENIFPLWAYYYSNDEKLLVYDFMPMRSLFALLHESRGTGKAPLNWETRSRIALGAARGFEYIHLQGHNVSHGNIKSSNVLLTNSFDARVSDFGLIKLLGCPTSTHHNISSGYRAPEVKDACEVHQKADIYSFGILLLELLTGKSASRLLNEEGVEFPRLVQYVIQVEGTSEVFDLELSRYQNVEEEMIQLLQLAIQCTSQFPDKRPSMSEVARRIEELYHSSLKKDQDQRFKLDHDDDDE